MTMSNPHIADRDVALIRDHNPIYSVVLEAHVELTDNPDGTAKGLCPFHEEKLPSFHVTPARGMWFCFGCGEGGDVFTFVMKKYNLTFTETAQRLAKRAGVKIQGIVNAPQAFWAHEATAAMNSGGHLTLTFGCGADTVTIEMPPSLTQLFVPALVEETERSR